MIHSMMVEITKDEAITMVSRSTRAVCVVGKGGDRVLRNVSDVQHSEGTFYGYFDVNTELVPFYYKGYTAEWNPMVKAWLCYDFTRFNFKTKKDFKDFVNRYNKQNK